MKLVKQSYLQEVNEAAKYLLGCEIVRTLENGGELRVRIVETEAYHQHDPASHTYTGKSERNKAMFGPAGHAYVYFTYGVHWCFNVTAGPEGHGAGVLIRAGQPLEGLDMMKKYRGTTDIHNLTNGPAKLAQALKIDKQLYAHDLTKKPLQIFEPARRNFEIVETTRIGISKAVDEIARFYIKDSPFVSQP